MKRLNEIKNEISKSKGFNDWDNVFNYACRSEIVSILNESAIQYAKECSKMSLENAINRAFKEVAIYDKYGEEDYCKNQDLRASITNVLNISTL